MWKGIGRLLDDRHSGAAGGDVQHRAGPREEKSGAACTPETVSCGALEEECRQLREALAEASEELAERARAERGLRRTIARLGEARRVIGMGYWEWNAHTGRVAWSDEMYALYGYEPGAVVPTRSLFTRHCHPDDVRTLVEVVQPRATAAPREVDYRIERADGAQRVLRACTLHPEAGEAEPEMVFGLCYDITEQRQYEQHLIEARQQADEARRHAEELLRLKTSLLDNISHELRTPLAAVIGFADILSGDLHGESQEFARLIQQSGERLLETLNSVLALAGFDSGATRLELRPVDLVAEAEETVELLRPQASEKRLRLDVAAVPATVLADAGALHRVLHNLIGNAIKFTAEGYVRVHVRGLPGEGRAVLEVEDTGCGIEAAFLPYVFEPFHQQSKGMARAHEGSGLGLTIVRKLVQLMEGTVEVASEVGRGTVVRVALPLAAEPALRLVVGGRAEGAGP